MMRFPTRHPREGGDPYARRLTNERRVYGSRIKSGMTEEEGAAA